MVRFTNTESGTAVTGSWGKGEQVEMSNNLYATVIHSLTTPICLPDMEAKGHFAVV